MTSVVAAGPRACVDLPAPAAPSRRARWVVFSRVARSAVRSGSTWGAVFGGYVALQALAYVKAYPTQASRDAMERAYGNNVGLNALLGAAHHINTVAGYAAWRVVGALSLLGGVWGVLTATRLVRGEEEAGRTELLASGQSEPGTVAQQSIGGLLAGFCALLVVTALVTVLTGASHSVGFSFGASLFFALVVCSGAATFLAVGVLTSQLADTRRRAATIAGASFGIAYVLRMIADTSASEHWLIWLTPLGWIEESRPLSDPRPLALVPLLALVATCLWLSERLATRRDLGAALLEDRGARPARTALLGSPLGLAVRLARSTAVAWLVGIAGFSLLLGSVAESSTNDRTASKELRQMIARLGGHGTLVEAYLGLTFLMVAFIVSLVAVGQVTAARHEEAEGHLDHLVAAPVGQASWLAGRLAVAASVVVLAGLTAGVFAWLGAVSQRGGAGLGVLAVAGLNVAAPSVLLLGAGALVLGIAPRRTSAVLYGYVTWSFLLVLTGGVVHVNRWLMDTSIFFHVAPAPATAVDWGSTGAMVGLGLLASCAGAVAMRTRDLAGA